MNIRRTRFLVNVGYSLGSYLSFIDFCLAKTSVCHDPDEDFDAFDLTKVFDFNTELNCPITTAEISKIISNLKSQKACSAEDYILNEYIKYSKDLLLLVYCKLFNVILQNGIVPDAWCKGYISPIYKNKDDLQNAT